MRSADETLINSDLKDLLRISHKKVEFLVIRGYAIMRYTDPRHTKDLDLVVRRSPKNAARSMKALPRIWRATVRCNCTGF